MDYVGGGPREILAGPYIPNNHQLFSMVGWATDAVIGESPLALRLWSVLPFMLGVTVVTCGCTELPERCPLCSISSS